MRTGELYQRYYGVFLGTVLSVDDPDKLGRVRVECDQFEDASDDAIWAAVVRPAAGDKTSVFFTPKQGDQVVLGYLAGDVGEPVILGYAHSQKAPPPKEVGTKRHGIVTDVGRVIFDEDDGSITVTFSAATEALESFIRLDSTGITLSGPNVNIVATTNIAFAAPSLAFAGNPSFSAPLTPGVPSPGPAKFDFSQIGVSFKTGTEEFCVNGEGVLLKGFAEQLYNLHTHSASEDPPGSPTLKLAANTPNHAQLVTDCEESS